MRSQHDSVVMAGVQFAMIEDSLGIAEDVVDMAFDIAVMKILSRGEAGWASWSRSAAIFRQIVVAGAAVRVEGVLGAQKAHAIEPRTKMPMAMRKMLVAPNRSAIQPEIGMKTASDTK